MKDSLVIDVDNTLADSIRAWCSLARKECNAKIEYDNLSSHKLVGVVEMEASLIFKLQDEVWRRWRTLAATEKGIAQVVRRLRQLGYAIFVATSGPVRHVDFVKNWLAHNSIKYDEFYSVRTKTDIPADVLVDDAVEEVSAFRSSGRTAFLYNRPWNRMASLPKVTRIDSLRELITILPKPQLPLAAHLRD
jgi:5'(3')-deoxyribonucleotidase